MLGHVPYKAAELAVQVVISRRVYPGLPTLGEFNEALLEVMYPPRLPPEDAWREFAEALSYYGHNDREGALRSMSPEVRELAARLDWYSACISEEPIGVLRGHFLRLYEAAGERWKRMAVLPPPVQAALLGGKLTLPRPVEE